MFEPVSTVVGLSLGYAALTNYVRSGSAVSSEATSSRKVAEEIIHDHEKSRSLFGAKHAFLEQAVELSEECSEAGWDGYDALPLDSSALMKAIELIRSLPDGFPVPEVTPEPDGSISLDWISSKHRVFSLSVGRTDRLSYAWIDGTDKGHGVSRSDGYSMPLRVLNEIQTVMNYGTSSLRIAC